MKRITTFVLFLMIGLLVLTSVAQAADGKTAGGYQPGFQRWTTFSDWTRAGVLEQPDNTLVLGPAASLTHGFDQPGAYNGKNFYNGSDYWYGEATSPWLENLTFQEAIASWDALTPDGAWVEISVRARIAGTPSKWYNLGVWASSGSTIQRHSVKLQGDATGYVAVDTLVLSKSKVPADALQLNVRLFSADQVASPVIRSLSLTWSPSAPKKVTTSSGDPSLWNTSIDVPPCSQMVYPDGGNVWCSPTSVSMVLGYWGFDPGPCEPRVRAAVAGVFDWVYNGHGNWPFNTAYAASRSNSDHPRMEGYVRRYTSLADLEPWIKAGVPVVMSIAWNKGDLTGAAIDSSNGHLIVLTGFDAQGNPRVNDPAASTDAGVPRTYLRGELEDVWLTNSGGTVYLIFPSGLPVEELLQ